MKRLISVLLAVILLSGCELGDVLSGVLSNQPQDTSSVSSDYGGINNISNIEISVNKSTGIELHDNAPEATFENAESFIEYFKNSEDFVTTPDFTDNRTPYEEKLAAEAEKAGDGIQEYYYKQDDLKNKVMNFVEKNIDKHNETAGLDDMLLILFLPMQSMELAMGATLTEKTPWETVSSGVAQAFTFMGGSNAKVVRNAAHDYTVTYTNDEELPVIDTFKANSQLGIQMKNSVDGNPNEIFEYICLGNKHIWQTATERMYLEYDGEKIQKLAYSKLDENSKKYGESDLIFENHEKCGLEWVSEKGTYHTNIIFDGKTMKITATAFLFGGLCEAVIENVQF